MDTTPTPEPEATAAPSPAAASAAATPEAGLRFDRQLGNAAKALLIVAVAVYLLQTFALVLQQLCTAALIGYLIVPAHHWLVRHRISPLLSSVVMIVVTLACFSVLGNMIYSSVEDLSGKIPGYRASSTAKSARWPVTRPAAPRGKARPEARAPPCTACSVIAVATCGCCAVASTLRWRPCRR